MQLLLSACPRPSCSSVFAGEKDSDYQFSEDEQPSGEDEDSDYVFSDEEAEQRWVGG